jgi:hypothetical protein
VEVSGQLHAPAHLPPGKSPRHPLERNLVGLQSRSGRSGEERKFSTPAGILSPNHSACSPALYHWTIPAHHVNGEIRTQHSFVSEVSHNVAAGVFDYMNELIISSYLTLTLLLWKKFRGKMTFEFLFIPEWGARCASQIDVSGPLSSSTSSAKSSQHIVGYLTSCFNHSHEVKNRTMKRIFGPRGEEISEGWRKLRNLYSSPNFIMMEGDGRAL